MRNKKGIEFLGGHVVNLIISVIVIIMLVFIGIKIYGLFVSEGSDLDQAKAELIKIKAVADQTRETKEPRTIETFFSPAKGWYIRSFYDATGNSLQNLPKGACLGKRGCLCICESSNCEGSNACIGAEYDLKFSAPHIIDDPDDLNLAGPGGTLVYRENMVLGESVYQIRTFYNEGAVVLRPVSR